MYKICSTAQRVEHKVLNWCIGKFFCGGSYCQSPSGLYLTRAVSSLWIGRVSAPESLSQGARLREGPPTSSSSGPQYGKGVPESLELIISCFY